MNFMRFQKGLRSTLGLAAVQAFVTALATAAGAPPVAHAQDAVVESPPQAPGHAPLIADPPSEPPFSITQTREPPILAMNEEDAHYYAVLTWRSRKSRNHLIGWSVATAVGAALVFPAEFTQCGDTDPAGESTLNRCSPAGKAMVIFGYPLLLVGGVAMIASGIALGVSNGQLRRIEQRARASRRKTRALRWDRERSGFVF